MYQALYRKYRPKTFSDVVGQPHVTQTLKNEIKLGRIGHAYLFIGSRGTGKTTCAKIFSKAVNCTCNETGDPCGTCDMCKAIDGADVMDIIELDAASNNSVNDIREICESAAFTPAKARYRVYIIDEVHMLSVGAFNALLKTLEEPPQHVIFILATTEAHKVPATILSRCQRFEFHRISDDDIASRLEYVAQQEETNLEKSAAMLIARISDGAMRDALAILDKCAGSETDITFDAVTKIVGVAGKEHIFALGDAIIEKNSGNALDTIDKLNKDSKDMTRICDELISYFRNIMLMKTTEGAREVISAGEEEYAKIESVLQKVSLSGVICILDTMGTAIERIGRGCHGRTELELAIVKLCMPELGHTPESLTARLEKVEQALNSGTSGNMTKENEKKPELEVKAMAIKSSCEEERPLKEAFVKEPQAGVLPSESAAKEKQLSANNVRKDGMEVLGCWNEVLSLLKSQSRTMAMAFKDSKAYVSGDIVFIDSKNDVAFELLRKSAQRDKMRLAIKEVTGRTYRLGPYTAASKCEKQADPLDELINTAREYGIKTEED